MILPEGQKIFADFTQKMTKNSQKQLFSPNPPFINIRLFAHSLPLIPTPMLFGTQE